MLGGGTVWEACYSVLYGRKPSLFPGTCIGAVRSYCKSSPVQGFTRVLSVVDSLCSARWHQHSRWDQNNNWVRIATIPVVMSCLCNPSCRSVTWGHWATSCSSSCWVGFFLKISAFLFRPQQSPDLLPQQVFASTIANRRCSPMRFIKGSSSI